MNKTAEATKMCRLYEHEGHLTNVTLSNNLSLHGIASKIMQGLLMKVQYIYRLPKNCDL